MYSKGSFSEINSLVVGEDKVKQFLNSRLEVSAKSIDYGKNNVTGSSPIDETRGLYLLGDTQIKVNGKKIPAYLLSNGGNLIAVSTDGQTAFELKQSDFAFLSNHKGDQNKAAEQRYYLYLMDRVGAYTEMDKPEVFTDSVFSDTITGSDGNDKIIFGSGSRENDVVKGEKGDDKFIFDHYIRNFDTNFDYGKYRGNYTLDGGEGDDTLIIGESKVNTYAGFFDADKYIIDEQSGKVKDSDKSYVQVRDKRLEFSNIEVIYGSDKKASDGVGNRNSNDDTIVADGLNNTIYGRGGDDFLHGNGGDDYLDGGQGSDTLIGGSGNDTLISGGTNRTKIADKLFGGAGNDVLYANGAGSVYMYGGEGTDIYKIDASKEGVSATISDQDKGNALTIKGIKTTDEIQALSVRMHQNGLVIGTIQNPDLIRWNPETQFSSIEDMVTAFTDRFSGIYFEDTKHVLDKSRLNKFLTDRLMERVISREDQSTGKPKYVSRFATSVVAARDGSDLNDQIVVDLYGDNKALNAHGGDDLIVAASGFAAKGATNNISTVNTGNGSDTVVIGNVDRQININFSENNVKKNEDKNTLLVRNMDMSELSYQQKSGRHELSYRGKVVASMDVLPDNLLFNDSSAGVTWIVSDIQSYLQSPTTYKPVNFLDANQKLGMAVKMNAELDENNNVWIQVNKRSGGILEFDLTIGNASSSSGFTINSIDKPKELDIASFVKEWAVRLQGGVRLNDTHLSMTEFATKLVQGLRNLNDDATFHIVDQGVETMLKNIEALDVSNRELAGVPVINAKQSLASELSAQLVHGDNAYIRLSAKGQEIARIPTTQKDIGDIPSLIKDNIAVIRFKDGRLDGDQLAKSIDSQITYHDKYGEGSKFVPEKVISYSENIAIKDFDFSYQSSNSPWYRNDRKWREVDRIYHFVDGANGKRWVYQSLTMPKGTLTNELSREVKFDSTSDYRLTLHGEGLSAAELRKNGQSSWAKLYAGDALIGKVNLSGSAEGVPGGKFDELVNTYTLDIDGQVFRQHEGKRLKLRLESKKGNLARVHDIKLEKLVGAMASFDSRQGIALGSNSDLFGNQYTVTASPLSHAELLWSR